MTSGERELLKRSYRLIDVLTQTGQISSLGIPGTLRCDLTTALNAWPETEPTRSPRWIAAADCIAEILADLKEPLTDTQRIAVFGALAVWMEPTR